MIAVALPSIIDEFDTDIEAAGWLVTGYLIALAALQPVTGKLGDRLGRRPLMLGGLAAFAVVSLAASFAPNLAFLIVFRILQAVAVAVAIAITFPNGIAFLREMISVDRRGAGFGLLGAAIGIAAGLGPTLGGLLVAAADWRAVFLRQRSDRGGWARHALARDAGQDREAAGATIRSSRLASAVGRARWRSASDPCKASKRLPSPSSQRSRSCSL